MAKEYDNGPNKFKKELASLELEYLMLNGIELF